MNFKAQPNIQCKIAAFMDDTSIPLRKLTFIPTVLDTIHKFEQITGSKLNISKTKGIVLKKENTGTHYGIECIYSSEKVLGIHIGNEIDLNGIWEDLCKKTEKKTGRRGVKGGGTQSIRDMRCGYANNELGIVTDVCSWDAHLCGAM